MNGEKAILVISAIFDDLKKRLAYFFYSKTIKNTNKS